MSLKTLVILAVSLAVTAACVFGVVYTNGETAKAEAAAAKAASEEAAAESAAKKAKSEENAVENRRLQEEAAERKAIENRKKAEADREKAKAESLTAAENRKKAEADQAKAEADKARAQAEAEAASDNRAAEKLKAETAKAERDKAKITAEAEASKAAAAAAALEREKLASEAVLAEKKLLEMRLIDIATMERDLIEYKQELDERERALHPEKTIRDIDSASGDEEVKLATEVKLPENDLAIPRGHRSLHKAKRLAGESHDIAVSAMRSNSVARLEKLYVDALKEDRVVDADFYRNQLETMYPGWKFTKKESEAK